MAPLKPAILIVALVAAFAAAVGQPSRHGESTLVLVKQQPDFRQPQVPCNPEGPPEGVIRIGADGTLSPGPGAEILADQVVTTEMDIVADLPQIAGGNDGGLADSPCTSSFDMVAELPPMDPPPGIDPAPTKGMPPQPPLGTALPSVTFAGPTKCLEGKALPESCGPPLDCSLPFCGRDIIFVHGMIDEALKDLVKAKHGLGGPTSFGALIPWPQGATAYTLPGGYFREWAYGRWRNYIQNKVGRAYRAAQPTRSPRLLIVAWPTTQRMEVGTHAVLTQIARAMQSGAGVMKLDMTLPDTPIRPAHLYQAGFCGRGCVIVSHSTGGPMTLAAMRLAALGGKSWLTPGLRAIPRFIKGHVASHPALSGSEIAYHALAATNSLTGGCAYGLDFIDALGMSPPLPTAIGSCAAVQALNKTVLVDLAPQVMDSLWRPLFEAPVHLSMAVPTVVVAAGHPTAKALIHWNAAVLPGFDDGVLTVDTQLGRKWHPGGSPRSLNLNAWGVAGAKYYDRGSPTAKAIPYYIDQSREHHHRPSSHAAAPHPYLSPNGMLFTAVSLNEVPAASSGLPNVYSFLQSTSDHFFPRYVGDSNASSQPNDASHGCPPHSYSYRPTGNYFGAQASVYEESRAVFENVVYTNQGRGIFGQAEADTGPIPLLSQKLQSPGAIEGEAKGRYIRLRLTLFKKVIFDKIFWLWKRQYVRMSGWRCRDEIDYTLDYAFRN